MLAPPGLCTTLRQLIGQLPSEVSPLTTSDLLQDYVKWRGPLFHRFLLAIVDDSASVRALAEYLLTDTLASKVCISLSQLCVWLVCICCAATITMGSGLGHGELCHMHISCSYPEVC